MFNKLRLTGFKSFVDGTDMVIQPGLTGIVGPNGCGKSNLVEALRWVMGETSAKPSQRRNLLEEAAGITGLHSRRHEAELRLKAAEENLNRLNDVIVALQAQLEGLKKQARQAVRYRTISESIRAADALVFFI